MVNHEMVECKAIQYNPIWYFPGGATAYLGGATAYLVGVGVVITRFKAKTQFKLDWTGTGTQLSLAIKETGDKLSQIWIMLKL